MWKIMCLILKISPLLHISKKCASHFGRDPVNEKINSLRKLKHGTLTENSQMKINSLRKLKHGYLIHTWLDNAFQGTVVHQAVMPSLHADWRLTWNYGHSPLNLYDKALRLYIQSLLYHIRLSPSCKFLTPKLTHYTRKP